MPVRPLAAAIPLVLMCGAGFAAPGGAAGASASQGVVSMPGGAAGTADGTADDGTSATGAKLAGPSGQPAPAGQPTRTGQVPPAADEPVKP